MEDSHHGRMRAVYRTEDAALGLAVGPNVDYLDQHPVAVHGRPDGMWGNKNVSRKAGLQRRTGGGDLRDHKTEAVAVHGQPAHNQVLVRGRLRNRVAIRLNLPELPPATSFCSRSCSSRRSSPCSPNSRTSCLYPAVCRGWRWIFFRMAESESMGGALVDAVQWHFDL